MKHHRFLSMDNRLKDVALGVVLPEGLRERLPS